WLINFTNPSGLVTEAVNKYTNIKCIGLCNVPIHMKMDIAAMLEADSKDIFVEFAGLNHLLWGTKVFLKGENVTSKVIEKLLDGASLSMKNIADLKWDPDFLRALNMIPSPYHRYFYMTDKLLEEEKEAAKEGGKGTRAEIVKAVEERLFEMYKDENLQEKPKELEKRGGAYYSDAAVSLISAIYNDKKEIHTVNTVNNGTIKELPKDSIIETNCLVDRRGVTPLNIDELPAEVIGLLQAVKSYEINAAEAAVKGDKNKAILALATHPLVPSASTAVKLVNELLEINKEYLPQFNN
ncbi:diacetylchitobiose-6-phosphate hydrolase, partial [Clostridium polynesiense]|uniref:family 4 glycosyl hydrolase n=1 Tax=Clostridium polynesiense TaxID=1325933 RepID=UPI00058DE4EC